MDINELHESLEEFLCVFLHTVFYVLELYPHSTFQAVKHYNTATYQSNHPGVCEWAEKTAVLCVGTIKESDCKTISFLVLSGGEPAERFVLDIQHLSSALKLDVHPANLQEQFRATIVAMYANWPQKQQAQHEPSGSESSDQSLIGDMPLDEQDRTLTIVLNGSIKTGIDSPWIPAQRSTHLPQTQKVRPVRFIEAGSLSMGVYYIDAK